MSNLIDFNTRQRIESMDEATEYVSSSEIESSIICGDCQGDEFSVFICKDGEAYLQCLYCSQAINLKKSLDTAEEI